MFVNAIMYYKVKNPIHAVANVDDYGASARLLAATTLRNVLGTLNLGDILSQRETIAREMQVLKLCCLSQEAKIFSCGIQFKLSRKHWKRALALGESWWRGWR